MNDVIIDINTKTGFANLRRFDNIIGNQAQNLQNKLKFELNDFINGVAWLEYQINGKKNYALMEKYNKGYQIDIKSCLLTSSHVEVDLKITEEETPEGVPIFVSTIVDLRVMKTINAEEEEPEQYPNWLEVANSKIATMNQLEETVNNNEKERITQEEVREKYFKELKQDVETGELNGATFTPNIDEECNLSWENDKGLANPKTVNIRGEKGEKGDCNFATFNVVNGKLVMYKTEDMLLDFKLEKNRLKVVI